MTIDNQTDEEINRWLWSECYDEKPEPSEPDPVCTCWLGICIKHQGDNKLTI